MRFSALLRGGTDAGLDVHVTVQQIALCRLELFQQVSNDLDGLHRQGQDVWRDVLW